VLTHKTFRLIECWHFTLKFSPDSSPFLVGSLIAIGSFSLAGYCFPSLFVPFKKIFFATKSCCGNRQHNDMEGNIDYDTESDISGRNKLKESKYSGKNNKNRVKGQGGSKKVTSKNNNSIESGYSEARERVSSKKNPSAKV